MTPEETAYHKAASAIKDAVPGQLFGKACYKLNGKAFVCFFQQCMVFKLSGTMHSEALQQPGSVLFDPSAKGRPMKEWVQVPFEHAGKWPGFTKAAQQYAESQAK